MSIVAFQMWGPFRQMLIAEHQFYIEQARKRLLSQFENIESEADQAAEQYLAGVSFDPENHSPDDFYEAANDKCNEFYQLLSDMRDRTSLGVIAGMYHEWDKKFREWIIRELRLWHYGEPAKQAIWQAKWSDLVKLFHSCGWDIASLSCYDRLNAMRLVVNVFKHGEGTSFDELKANYPEFFPGPIGWGGDPALARRFLDHTQMRVEDRHVEEFSAAIVNFWFSVPDEIFAKDADVPRFLEKAILASPNFTR